jgi:adenylosuccinate synthase
MHSKLSVVVGGQYGSEGKGAIAAHLSKDHTRFVTCVRIGGPNAGHTVIGAGPTGKKHPWRLRTIPVAAVSNPTAKLVIAAGSEIDPAVLQDEADQLEAAGYNIWDRLTIDSQATILEPEHIDIETAADIHQRLGSTGKGIGAARAARIMRTARLWKDLQQLHRTPPTDTSELLRQALADNHHIIIEGTQGYGLGLHAGHYPQCTSNDARAIDFLAMAGINPWDRHVGAFRIYLVARVNPIRVAGNSGPLAGETSWEQLGLEPELTTVTRKVRRVGAWDPELVRDAVTANGGAANVRICLTMLDHAVPAVAGWTGPLQTLPAAAQNWIDDVETKCKAPVAMVGTGPDTIAGGTR